MNLQRAGPGAEVLDVAGRTNTRARRINDTGHTNNPDRLFLKEALISHTRTMKHAAVGDLKPSAGPSAGAFALYEVLDHCSSSFPFHLSCLLRA